jgi:hypothetical protein
MTLTEFEASLVPLPGFQRFPLAGAAQKLRQLLADGETFAAARDRIVTRRDYNEALGENNQLATFSALTGP